MLAAIALLQNFKSSEIFAVENMPFFCNATQTTCEIETKELTVGDQLIFLDQNNKLRARGKVIRLQLGRRVVEITKKWGPITKATRVRVINFDTKESYKTYKDGTKKNIGLGLGLASYDVGTDVVGLEFSGYYEQKIFRDMKVLGRGQVWTGSGVVNRVASDGSPGTVDANVKFTGFGGLGGVSYTLLDGQDISFRGELSVGFKYLSASVGGNKDEVADGGYDTGIKNGIGAIGRAEISAAYNVDFALMYLYFSQNYFHNASAPIFGLGFVWNLDNE
jgi:hypothetical protein